MSNNEMVSVPRELLERIKRAGVWAREVDELHALLAAPANQCGKCGSETVQACNDLGCHFFESGNGEPVPPAGGEPEVLEKREKINEEFVTLNQFEKRVYHSGRQVGWNACFDTHVTRLQAEVQAYRSFEGVWQMALDLLPERFRSAGGLVPGLQDLIAERDDIVERYGKMQTGEEKMLNRVIAERDALKAEVERLNSELTKARELLNLLYWGNLREPTEADCVEIERQINAGLAHQSAPAAKGECKDCLAVQEAEQNPNTQCDSCGWAAAKGGE